MITPKIINKEHLLRAEQRDVQYLNYILCENDRDIVVERYFSKDGNAFYVSLYADKTHMVEIDCYNGLDANMAYDIIEMFFQQNKLNPNYVEL